MTGYQGIFLLYLGISAIKIEAYTSFYLYRRTDPKGVGVNNGLPNNFDGNKTTFVILHGMGGHHQDICTGNVEKALLATRDVNVIIPNYSQTAFGYLGTYQAIAKSVSEFLIKNRINPANTVVIGQSIGAQIAGILHRYGFKPNTMLGLDPAGPGFSSVSTNGKLSPLSAQNVQAVHTNVGGLGSSTLDAGLDVYINRGKDFPCCSTTVCRHVGACNWLASTIRNGPTAAYSCRSQREALAGTCNGPAVYTGFGAQQQSGGQGRTIAHVSLSQCVSRGS